MGSQLVAKKTEATVTGGVHEVEAYLATLGEPARATLTKLRETIRSLAPAEATEGIYYGVPAFLWGKGLAGYNAGKKFCSYYPMSGRTITALKEDLEGYETTSGSIHFGVDKPMPLALMRKLIRQRMHEIKAGER
jgi:uncharacterized protein YdhG (YjbR/CyaY superfamily)